MTRALSIEATSGPGASVNLVIQIPAHVWADLNNGKTWSGQEANGDVASDSLKINKVTIQLGG